jgi:hypothetical protein
MIKDEASYQKALSKIYDLMQLESLTDKQGKTLDKLAKDVELYEAELETCDFRKKLNEVWSAIEELEKKGDSRTERDIINLVESRKKRALMCQQFADLHTKKQKLKKEGE